MFGVTTKLANSFSNASRRLSFRSIGRNLAWVLLLMIGLSGTAQAVSLSFTTFSLESGTDLQPGAVYRFDDVTTGVDALVTVVSLNNGATLSQIDDATNPPTAGVWEALQPQYTGVDGSVTLNVEFVTADTSTSTTIANFTASAVDVDGDGISLTEFVEFSDFDRYTLESTTNLNVTESGTSTRFQANTVATVPGIGTAATENIASVVYEDISSFAITLGSEGTSTAFPRLTSINFNENLPNTFVNPETADLEIVKTASPLTVTPGDTITYTIMVTNTGDVTLTDIDVADTLPANVTYVAESTSATGPVAQTVTVEDIGPVSIPDDPDDDLTTCNSPVVRNIAVTDSFVLSDVNLGVNADHPFRGALRVRLTSPAATTVVLITTNGADADDNYDLVLDDESSSVIDDGNNDDTSTPLYDRNAQPDNPLNAFDGENSSGTWIMEICDTDGFNDQGRYNSSQLVLQGVPQTLTKTNQTGDLNPLVEGDPTTGNLVVPGDGFGLAAGDTLTVTFDVTVDTGATGTLTNTATADVFGLPPKTDTATNFIPSLDSFTDNTYTTEDNVYYRDPNDTGNAEEEFFVGGPGFPPSTNFTVAYYDGNGDLVFTETVTTDASGNLQSAYTVADGLDTTDPNFAYGNWTGVVVPDGTTPAATKAAQDASGTSVIEDPFEVRSWSETEFTDAAGNPVPGGIYPSPDGPGGNDDNAYLNVVDQDRNTDPTAIECISVTITDSVTGDSEAVTLCETGPNTGVFANDTSGNPFSIAREICTGAPVANDGILCVTESSQLTATYTDPNDTGDTSNDIVTNPITLASFEASEGVNPGDVHIEWSTSMETGNVGFDIYARGRDSGWVKLNAEVIPSNVINSVTVQHYAFDVSGVRGKVFAIVDIDIKGAEVVHGPFHLGKRYGAKRAERAQTDWDAIRAEHRDKKAKRKARKQHKMQQRQQRLEQHMDMEERRMRQQLKRQQRAKGLSMLDTPTQGLGAVANTTWWQRGLIAAVSWMIPAAHAMDVANIEVDQTGLQRVTHEQLVAAGIDLTGVRKDRLSLSSQGESVQRRVLGPKFVGPGTIIEFVGKDHETLYTQSNIYTLSVSDTRVKQAPVSQSPVPSGVAQTTYLETVRVEHDNAYSSSAPNNDPWYDTYVFAWGTTPGQIDVAVDIDNYVPSAGSAVLDLDVWGWIWTPENPDHHLVVELNGTAVADEFFDGLVHHPINAPLPANVLQAGTNTLSLKLPADTGAFADLVTLDHYAVTYPRSLIAKDGALVFKGNAAIYEVSSLPDKNVVVYRESPTGKIERIQKVHKNGKGSNYTARFSGVVEPAGESTFYVAAVANMTSSQITIPVDPVDITSAAAEYLIITHPDFIGSELDLLVNARQAQGFSVEVVDVEQVYAQFGHYLPGAQPIKEYIAYAHANKGTTHVLLVGGDSYDYHDNLGLGTVSFLPTLYAQTDDLVYFAPVDAKYTDVDGDNVPDLAIGRFPVRTAAELTTMVNQTLTYGQITYPQTAVFAADKFDASTQYSFKADSDTVIDQHLSDWDVATAYIDDLGVQGAKDMIIDSINNGVALTSFFGHSDLSIWTFDGLLNGADVDALTNVGLPTVVTQWGCWNTYYVSPYEDTLGHRFMLNSDRGAASVLGASTLTEAAAERVLAMEVFERLLTQGTTMGEAILQAKQAYAQTYPDQLDVILGWTQLGDPALVVQQ